MNHSLTALQNHLKLFRDRNLKEAGSTSIFHKKKNWILAGFIFLKFLLQYLVLDTGYNLQHNEYLHLDQANHLAWGYESVPPLTSWLSTLISYLGGDLIWIKFIPALFGALTLFVIWKLTDFLSGSLYAMILGAICILFSVLLRLNTLYQPNSLDVLCWTTFYYILIKYFTTNNPKLLYWAALVFAIGFLNKYNIIFLIIGLFPALLLSPQRSLFYKKQFYYALLFCIILILPNLLWQYNHEFPVFSHLKTLSASQLVNVNPIHFISSQLLYFVGSHIVIVAGLTSLYIHQPFKQYRSMFWAFFFTLALFLYLKAKAYYAIGLYPVYIAFGSVYLSKVLSNGRRLYLKWMIACIPLFVFIPMFKYTFPNRSPEYIIRHHEKYKKLGLLRWVDGKDHLIPQDFADMLGWKELAEKVDKIYSAIPDREHTLILCDNYGQAGAINYYSKHGIKAVSFNADYINWFDLSIKYKNLIRIKVRSERNEEFKKTSPYFTRSVIADSVTNIYAREFGTTIFSFTDVKIDMNERIAREIMDIRDRD